MPKRKNRKRFSRKGEWFITERGKDGTFRTIKKLEEATKRLWIKIEIREEFFNRDKKRFFAMIKESGFVIVENYEK